MNDQPRYQADALIAQDIDAYLERHRTKELLAAEERWAQGRGNLHDRLATVMQADSQVLALAGWILVGRSSESSQPWLNILFNFDLSVP